LVQIALQGNVLRGLRANMLLRLIVALFIVSAVSIRAADDIAPQTVVVKWKVSSASLKTWTMAGRSGSFDVVDKVVGSHTSAPYISDAVVASVAKAYATRNALLALGSQQPWMRLSQICVITYAGDLSPRIVAAKLSSLPDVEYAEPLPIRTVGFLPNDPLSSVQYHLALTKAMDVWDILPDSGSVVVGIIDTGIDTTHEDLQGQIWRNVGELGTDNTGRDKRSNGIDDDGNGFVDDWFGWDFVGVDGSTGDNAPLPGNPHGTHVGGIVGAVVDNGIGVAGVGRRMTLMPIKVGNDDPFGRTVARTSEGILYAASNGARVINCSFGSASQSFADIDVINTAHDLGTLIVAAAGNESVEQAYYPAAFPTVLSVAATNALDKLAFFSNRHSTVDVCAPGQSILSTIPGNEYTAYDGTSMASPVVAAIAAMLRLVRPELSPDDVLAILRATADDIDSINPFAVGRIGMGRVNALRAFTTTNIRHAIVTESSFTDENADSVFESGERLHLHLTVKNLLSPVTNARIVVNAAPSNVSFTPITPDIVVGVLSKNEERQVPDDIIIQLSSDVPLDAHLAVLVSILDGDTVVGKQLVTATINPSYRTVFENDITVTVNSTGNIAYNDYPNNAQGVGFTYKNGPNLLYEGALLVGKEPTYLPNVARGANASVKDTNFHASQIVEVRRDSVISGLRTVSRFDDRYDAFAAGVNVKQTIYQSNDDSVKNIILMVYDITNRGDTAIPALWTSQFHDWDIGPAGANNGCAWDAERGIALIENVELKDMPRVGVSMISPLPLNVFAIDNDGAFDSPSIYDNFIRAEKWRMMSSGVARTNSNVTDVSLMLGGGPFALGVGETQQICYVIAAGYSYEEISRSIAAGTRRAIGMGLNAIPFVPLPTTDQVLFVDDGTVINTGSHTIRYSVRTKTPILLDVVDLFGSTVSTIVEDFNVSAGEHNALLTIHPVATGVYFVRLQTVDGTSFLPIQIIR